MSIIYYLIPIAIVFVIIGVYAFFWATKSEQFEDLEKQGLSILMDDDMPKKETAKPAENNTDNQSTKNGRV
ncbi:cbb3-type cytochrome oxidase assembly protein CcoS [Psychrosphaera ytuae]|uniref:Cbb3-type cytochrome oxidase assembly protein CcoS n=1 Tax=Psychrosphaera ytuae TaxID=2820710 RepID=A0A975HII5_9GAMM|nr:cbb3-type cytochrome oxidase assembly protein CcoS [Psychrosphaera ytuae]QTH64257.1 cbb3-type cytochrome oxidase assembly protein CcoS [Psychrosphaera ytuae]